MSIPVSRRRLVAFGAAGAIGAAPPLVGAASARAAATTAPAPAPGLSDVFDVTAIPEPADAYPENYMFGTLPACGSTSGTSRTSPSTTSRRRTGDST